MPRYPKDKAEEICQSLGYIDKLLVEAEQFALWVIQGSEKVREIFPADKAGLNVKFVDDITPFRTRKVRILNGAHTAMVPVGLLSNVETVRECVEHNILGEFIREIIEEEISPTIDLPQNELSDFSSSVIERFRNPFIRYELRSISLNSISKFKVRVLPTIKDFFVENRKLPNRLVFALSCLIKLYQSDTFQINDSLNVIRFFNDLKKIESSEEVASAVLANIDFWDDNLTEIEGLVDLVSYNLQLLRNHSPIKYLQ